MTRSDYRPADLLQVATTFVNREALRRRELHRVKFTGDVKALKQAQRKLSAVPISTGTLTEAQLRMFNTIMAPTLELLPEIPTLLRNQDILQEESEMAWWMLTGFSLTASLPFRKLPPAFLPIVLAYELADRTRVFPAGVSISHLIAQVLHTIGREDANVSLPDIANSLPEAWTAAVLVKMPPVNPRVTPVLYLLEQQSRRGDQWARTYQDMTGVDAASTLPASKIGYAFYQECLTSRLRTET